MPYPIPSNDTGADLVAAERRWNQLAAVLLGAALWLVILLLALSVTP